VKLIVGLGNPGPRYSGNRHNAGYRCVERFSQQCNIETGKVMFKAYVSRGDVEGTRVIVARPLTFMNLSGLAVRPLVRWYHLPLSDLLIVHDDLDLPLGRLRLRLKGGSGGHKGMRSIIDSLGSEEFPRLRVGIGRPATGVPERYVLSDFTTDELAAMLSAYDRAADAIVSVVTEGIGPAMNKTNTTLGPSVQADTP
jgi:PTH1 family peptidyl-tRNA hydrolase